MKRALGIGFYVLVAGFLVWYALGLDFSSLSSLQPGYGLLLVATALALFVRFWFARIWLFFLRSTGPELSANTKDLDLVYAKSWLARYVPGSVVWVASKIYFASKLGVSKTRLAISSYLEALIQLVTVVLIALVLIAINPGALQITSSTTNLLLVLALLGVVAIIPGVLRWYANLGFKILRKSSIPTEHFPSAASTFRGVLLFAVSGLLSGLTFYLVLWALVPDLDHSNLFYVLALTNVASALSMLAVFAPAGIGVREGVLITGLTVIVDPATALAVALLMRAMSVGWDLLFFAIARVRKVGQ